MIIRATTPDGMFRQTARIHRHKRGGGFRLTIINEDAPTFPFLAVVAYRGVFIDQTSAYSFALNYFKSQGKKVLKGTQ